MFELMSPGAIFHPKITTQINLVEVLRKKNSKDFLHCSMFELVNPGAWPVMIPVDHMNNHGRGILGDATCKISKLYTYFQRRRFFKFFAFFTFLLAWQPELWVDFINFYRRSPKEHACRVSTRSAHRFSRYLQKLYADERTDGRRITTGHILCSLDVDLDLDILPWPWYRGKGLTARDTKYANSITYHLKLMAIVDIQTDRQIDLAKTTWLYLLMQGHKTRKVILLLINYPVQKQTRVSGAPDKRVNGILNPFGLFRNYLPATQRHVVK